MLLSHNQNKKKAIMKLTLLEALEKGVQANVLKHMHWRRSTEQKIEWTYALDIHFNAFFPYFLVLYVVQFFLLPVLLLDTFLAAFLSNILYAVALSAYWYVTFLGYTSMPFLQNTEFYLYPLFPVLGFCGIASLVGFNLTLYFMNWFLYWLQLYIYV